MSARRRRVAIVAIVAFVALLPVALTGDTEPSYIRGSECSRMVAQLRETRDYVPAMRPCLGEEDSPNVQDILDRSKP